MQAARKTILSNRSSLRLAKTARQKVRTMASTMDVYVKGDPTNNILGDCAQGVLRAVFAHG
jgi:hypothetical protein